MYSILCVKHVFRDMLFLLLFTVSIVSATKSDYSELSNPEWKEVISEGGLHIGSGRVKRFVELNNTQRTPDSKAKGFGCNRNNAVTKKKNPNIPYQACTLPNGKNGHCRHLHHCIQEEFKRDFLRFMDYLCIIQRSSIGVCCPDDKVAGGPEGVAGDLPATAPKDEDSDIKFRINNAENRGCGLSTRAQGRVTGARPANPREWPWMASITPEGFEQYCGGVLISDRHVLTAAHCTRRWKAEELYVRLGEYDLKRTNDSRSYNFRVLEIRQHEKFDLSTYHNDVAILKLHRPAVFNTYVWPICLPPRGLQLDDQPAVVIGWGTLFYGGPHSNVLLEVTVPIWNQQKCADAFVDSVFDETICAGAHEGRKDACQGDSGGPLMYQMSSGRWAVIGVVSWGIRCGEPNHPGLYARVDSYLEWIVQNARF